MESEYFGEHVYNKVMDFYDEITSFLLAYPEATSMDVAYALNINLAKAIYELNQLVDARVVIKTEARSPTNNRIVLGYTLMEGFDQVHDNPDGSMPIGVVLRVCVRMGRRHGFVEMVQTLETSNEWRRKHSIQEISLMEVLHEYRFVYGSAERTKQASNGNPQ